MSLIDPTTTVPSLSEYDDRTCTGNVVAAGVFHAAQHQHLGAAGRHLEHLLERDGVQLAGVAHDPRVRAEDAVHVGVDLADVGVQRGGQRDRGGVRAAAAQRGDVPGVLADALEAGDQHDAAFVERGLQPARRDVDDLRVAVGAGGDDAGLRTGERAGAARPAIRSPWPPARWRCAHRPSAACRVRGPAAPGTPAEPGPAGRRWCRPSPRPPRRHRCPAFWSRRCVRRRGGSGRRRPPRIRRTSARRAPLLLFRVRRGFRSTTEYV